MQAADYHGPRAAEDTSLQFSMRTAAAKGMQQHPNPVSYLPSGTLISGLSAAVMSYCQVQSSCHWHACTPFAWRHATAVYIVPCSNGLHLCLVTTDLLQCKCDYEPQGFGCPTWLHAAMLTAEKRMSACRHIASIRASQLAALPSMCNVIWIHA